jgi:hypothetical protein
MDTRGLRFSRTFVSPGRPRPRSADCRAGLSPRQRLRDRRDSRVPPSGCWPPGRCVILVGAPWADCQCVTRPSGEPAWLLGCFGAPEPLGGTHPRPGVGRPAVTEVFSGVAAARTDGQGWRWQASRVLSLSGRLESPPNPKRRVLVQTGHPAGRRLRDDNARYAGKLTLAQTLLCRKPHSGANLTPAPAFRGPSFRSLRAG